MIAGPSVCHDTCQHLVKDLAQCWRDPGNGGGRIRKCFQIKRGKNGGASFFDGRDGREIPGVLNEILMSAFSLSSLDLPQSLWALRL